MKNNLLFDFIVDKENKTIQIKREFDASLELVWNAWTTAEILDQWWAPAPLRNQTKHLDFREGGYWLYTMLDENNERINFNNEEIWSIWNYKSIIDFQYFSTTDGFCDENGVLNPAFPSNLWEVWFSAQNNCAIVKIISTFDKIEDLEQTIEMGFKEGFTAGLNQLEQLLKS